MNHDRPTTIRTEQRSFVSYDLDTAPAAAREILAENAAKIRHDPEPAGAPRRCRRSRCKRRSPGLTAFEHSSLAPLEREVLAMTMGVKNGCHYCVSLHRRLLEMLDSTRRSERSTRARPPARVAQARSRTRIHLGAARTHGRRLGRRLAAIPRRRLRPRRRARSRRRRGRLHPDHVRQSLDRGAPRLSRRIGLGPVIGLMVTHYAAPVPAFGVTARPALAPCRGAAWRQLGLRVAMGSATSLRRICTAGRKTNSPSRARITRVIAISSSSMRFNSETLALDSASY